LGGTYETFIYDGVGKTYSGLMGLISTQLHQDSKAEDNRKWIAPHIPVSLSSTDYFTGNDKALNNIIEVIKTTESSNKN